MGKKNTSALLNETAVIDDRVLQKITDINPCPLSMDILESEYADAYIRSLTL